MKNNLRIVCVVGIVCCICSYLPADERMQETCQIGVMVQAIDAVLKNPDLPDALETVVTYGTDSRYYVMIRGWLIQELRGVESQLSANRNVPINEKHQKKAAFLKQAIRRIDLE